VIKIAWSGFVIVNSKQWRRSVHNCAQRYLHIASAYHGLLRMTVIMNWAHYGVQSANLVAFELGSQPALVNPFAWNVRGIWMGSKTSETDKPESQAVPARPVKLTKRRREIYLQAARLFVTKGFAATSMLFTLVSNAMDDFDDQVLHPASQETDAYKRLMMALKLHISNVTRMDEYDGNPMTRIADQVSGLSPDRQTLIAQRKRRYLEMLAGTLDELKMQGKLREGLDTRVAALSVTMMILGINSWRRPSGRLSKGKLGAQVLNMALNSVLKPGVLEERHRSSSKRPRSQT
jgi:hypothetical protein